MWRLRSKTAGPPMPLAVKSIGPAVRNLRFSRDAVMTTFSIPTPASAPHQGSAVTRRTRQALGWTIVWPKERANSYPSPVEPVWGQVRPPVAIITDKAVIRSRLVSMRKWSVAFVIFRAGLAYRNLTDSLRAWSRSTLLTSVARLVTGKTQPGFSTFVWRPCCAKYRRRWSAENSWRACRRNRPEGP